VAARPWPFSSPLFTRVPRETVRKGFEQRSEPGFGRYTGYEKGREVPSRGSAGLRSRRLRGFSDGFSRQLCKLPWTTSEVSPAHRMWRPVLAWHPHKGEWRNCLTVSPQTPSSRPSKPPEKGLQRLETAGYGKLRTMRLPNMRSGRAGPARHRPPQKCESETMGPGGIRAPSPIGVPLRER
jgi:hypothetical protein